MKRITSFVKEKKSNTIVRFLFPFKKSKKTEFRECLIVSIISKLKRINTIFKTPPPI